MCGISGFIDFSKQSTIKQLMDMTDTLIHRGPDGSGYELFTEENYIVGLGQRRLSIIDLSANGKQPMLFDNFIIVLNGEVYNYKEIRAELEVNGHQFIGNSDTEVVLHAFKHWGIKCIEKFIGMFAFVVYDRAKNKLFCVRDRTGVKPFYYYWKDNLFLFTSELKAFHKHPQFVKEINYNALAAFIQFGNVPSEHCIFNNCFKLKAGHLLELNLINNSFEIIQYWSVYDCYNKSPIDISFEEAKNKTEKLMYSAFNYRMIADVPVGVFLSGGYDSACLTAILQKERNERLKTFTIGVPDIGLNEANDAKMISNYLGTEHVEFTCTQKEAIELIDDLPYIYDEPFADSSAIPTALVSKLAKQYVTVALSADGGDEVFAGYNRYDYLMKHGRFLNRIPKQLRIATSSIMSKISSDKIPLLNKKYNFHNRYEKLKSLLKDPSSKNMMLSLSKQFSDDELNNLFVKKFIFPETLYLSENLKEEFYTPLRYMMAIDYQTYLPDDILQKVDRASMFASLEAREPFLDYRLIEWAAQLPDNFKYNNGIKKHILKEITHRYIPKELMDRPKKGFAIPIENWLADSLKEKVMYFLDEKRINSQKIFNASEINILVKQFYLGKREYAVKIWYLLMFQMWYYTWMESK